MNAPTSFETAVPLEMAESEQYAAWVADARANFVSRFPKAPERDVRDAAHGYANLMMFNAKRRGRFA